MGSYVITVNAGKDTKGQTVGKESQHNVVFNEVNPRIRFIGEGIF